MAPDLWQRVQAHLRHNGRTGGTRTRNKYGALLRGILHCANCDVAMMHTYSQKKHGRRYRYYVYSKAQKQGWHRCPTKSVPAPEIERFVVDHIRCTGRDPALIAETLTAARRQSEKGIRELQAEQQSLERELKEHETEIRGLIGLAAFNGDGKTPATARLAELQGLTQVKERRATEVREQLIVLNERIVNEDEVRGALAQFDPLWETLAPRERARIIHLLVERVAYDGEKETIAVTFRPTGLKGLRHER